MKSAPVSGLFLQATWSKELPKEYTIPSVTFRLSKEDIDYLTDDETNPDVNMFSLKTQIQEVIQKMNGQVFAKFGNRSAKDCSNIDRKVTSVRELIMMVKMSEFLTQALCEEDQESEVLLREYVQLFEKQVDEFRVYVIKDKVVGICQKNPSYIAGSMTVNQVTKIKEIASLIIQKLSKNQNPVVQPCSQFVFELYIPKNASQVLILAIEPFHIHSLSLFTEQQLRKHAQKNKDKPKLKTVQKESQLKQIDLSEYKSGFQLKKPENAQAWMEFMGGKKESEE